jgi:hypothetical protein
VGDEPGGFVTRAEHGELDALRGRAYAEDADIYDDVAAVSRLRELEDRLRVEHFAAPAEWTAEFSLAMLNARSGTTLEHETDPPLRTAGTPPSHPNPPSTPTPRPLSMRWHEALVATTAAVGVLLAAVAWAADDRLSSADPAASAIAAGASEDLGSATYAALYELHLDNLREELLSGPGMEAIGDRLFRGLLRPQGVLYGRAVGTGPTRDREFCMIVSDTPAPAVACISAENSERTVSVILPPASAESSDSPPATAAFVKYTLSAEGIVVAEPLHPVPKAP